MVVLSIMMKRLFFYIILAVSVAFASCEDNDSFGVSPSNIFTFSEDTINMDTVFSTVPTPTYSFWLYNNSGDGIRINQARLQRGNQTGFRVNVDGFYLDNSMGSLVNNIEVRDGDSIRVFVELTSATNGQDVPVLLEDDLLFLLESGVEQKVNLRAFSWDAQLMDSLVVKSDMIIESSKPIVIRKGIVVDSQATLTVNHPTTLYFGADAGIDVFGRLLVNQNTEGEVVMRGDRTDRMFPYLPYDRVSGQWKGIRIHSSSFENEIRNADIHSGYYGIICDSVGYDQNRMRLSLENVTIHNCKGPGVQAFNSNISIVNCQISNTLGDCLSVYGGNAFMVYTTLAQFYPFSADRGVALRFANYDGEYNYPLHLFECYNSLVTGYADDVIMGETNDSTVTFNYHFQNSLLRTPVVEDSVRFVNVIWETAEDSVQGKMHFINIDEDNLVYDFHLDSLSTARNKAISATSFPFDRDGVMRKEDTPDVGCYEYVEKESGIN